MSSGVDPVKASDPLAAGCVVAGPAVGLGDDDAVTGALGEVGDEMLLDDVGTEVWGGVVDAVAACAGE
jgi:hypothetical protein